MSFKNKTVVVFLKRLNKGFDLIWRSDTIISFLLSELSVIAFYAKCNRDTFVIISEEYFCAIFFITRILNKFMLTFDFLVDEILRCGHLVERF